MKQRDSYRRIAAVMAASALAILAVNARVEAATRDETISVVDIDKLQWKDYPGLPGVTFTVVNGDPSKPGLYTIRAKFAIQLTVKYNRFR